MEEKKLEGEFVLWSPNSNCLPFVSTLKGKGKHLNSQSRLQMILKEIEFMVKEGGGAAQGQRSTELVIIWFCSGKFTNIILLCEVYSHI